MTKFEKEEERKELVGRMLEVRRRGKPWSDYTTTRDLEFAYSVADLSPHYRVFERDGAYLKVACKDLAVNSGQQKTLEEANEPGNADKAHV